MTETYIETKKIALKNLTPLVGNPRKGDVAMIRESLRFNHQYKPLIVRKMDDGSLVILTGNHTYQALVEEGLPAARCEIHQCTDEEAARIVLVDNRSSDRGTYDVPLLLEFIGSLDDLDGTGYNLDDYEDLLAGLDKVQETVYQETNATYAETADELQARTEKLGEIKSQDSQGIRETVLVLPQEQHDELHGLLQDIRRHLGESDLTNGELMLRCARTLAVIADIHNSHEDGCACEWCKVARASADPVPSGYGT